MQIFNLEIKEANHMLYIKEANIEDVTQEFIFITILPEDENGFTNPDYGCTKDQFENSVLPGYIESSKGIGLPEGFVPETYFFLWEDNVIIGLFKVRHYLTDVLRNGAGHIGYGIKNEYRGKGYATSGLQLVLEKAREIIKEDEIYLAVHKNNPASLKVQLNNGAYIHHENDKEYFTRIKK